MVLPDTSVIDPYEYYIWTADPEYHLGIGMRNLSGGAEPTLLFVKQDSEETHFSEEGVTTPHFVQGGFLAYQIGGDFGPIKVRPFDSVSLEFTGPPQDLLPEIEWSARTVGAEGSLVFVPEQFDQGASADRLFLVNIANKSIRSIDPALPGEVRVVRPAFSPDGLSIALDTQNNESPDRFITVFDLETGLFSRRTFAEPRLDPDWSADGAFLFFDGRTSRSPGIYRQAIGDVGDEVLLVEGNAGNPNLSRNAKWLAFSRDSDLLLSDLQTGNEIVLDSSEGAQRFPDFSPDSRYIVFETTSSGISEVVVRPVSGSSFHSITTPDARKPVWGPDGKSLYYLVVSDGIYRVPVTTEPDFEVLGAAEKIVSIRGVISAQRFDVSPDGNTLAITANSVEPETGSNRNKYSTIMWWRNWAQSLSKD